MPRLRSPNRDKAFLLWKKSKGKKKNKDIAEELGVSEKLISRWKKEDDWANNGSKCKSRKSTQSKSGKTDGEKKKIVEEKNLQSAIIKHVEKNEELTENQKLFCVYWMKNHNATQAYFKAYECTYNTASTEGPRNLLKPAISAEITRLKEIRNKGLLIDPEDIVERYMKIAFSDITDFAVIKENNAYIMNSNMIDGGIISEIKQTKFGVGIKLENRMKALEWLGNYFLMNPMDQHKRKYDEAVIQMREKELKLKEW